MLTEEERVFIRSVAEMRFSSKRQAGISSTRSDGSLCSEENDIDATGAEYFAAKYFKQNFDDSISTNGDVGHDFVLDGKTVEVIWLGRDKTSNEPRNTGNLIVNPHEPKRWADLYVVIGGGFDEGYYLVGWTDHESLVSKPKVDFGFGKRFAMRVEHLYKGEI